MFAHFAPGFNDVDISPCFQVSTQPIAALNVAFSQAGLNVLGVTDNLNDTKFSSGQQADIPNIGDPGTTNWESAFVSGVHGVFLLASDQQAFIEAGIALIEAVFGKDITNVYSLQGQIRPGAEAGHERKHGHIRLVFR